MLLLLPLRRTLPLLFREDFFLKVLERDGVAEREPRDMREADRCMPTAEPSSDARWLVGSSSSRNRALWGIGEGSARVPCAG